MDTSTTHAEQTVLLLGGTGRTGGRVLQQLLGRGVHVRAVVRSAERLPAGVAGDPRLTVVEADLLSLSDEQVKEQVDGCDVVISCLGHTISAQGVFGKPRDLVTRSVERAYRATRDAAARAARQAHPHEQRLREPPGRTRHASRAARAGGPLAGARPGPPARDNQRAADFLHDVVEPADPHVQWVVVRPDTLKDGDVTEYALHEGLVDSLFRPGETNRANVAHFMCELATDAEAWAAWQGKLPVIVNASPE